MVIFKVAIPRRTFLRGVGATLALPVLDAMDYQLSSRTRVMGKVAGGRLWEPFGLPSATNHPASTNKIGRAHV